ncbi:hypothetical protein FB192DRAFT_1276885 [Mucor lusitanicus]|uniref:Uncharacterized protein n=1 Tax=Mucor circinelloides f. lusitanicus TaxID=29924 RepID=A0A8H4BN41_MUCCL|nr:hypothetical protein FB192DRAFT_1276885 [Mucor lusitanicus]
MNNIVDVSDTSEGSHMDMFPPQAQVAIEQLISREMLNENQANCRSCTVPEAIITKFLTEEIEDKFLARVIKDIEEASNVEKVIKRVYIQILESMLYDKYLYEENGSFSEADLIVKIDTESKMDLRIFHTNRPSPDIMVNEFAKASKESKYYSISTRENQSWSPSRISRSM